ncbi:vacuolar protein sorting-associated protein 51 [Histomonas meleagridis]|nr:vacuolar protein sorting-associated protein 51 [Histomonas meleagridis]
MDINSPSFEVQPFFQSLVASKDLTQLKREYTQLECDIHTLDNELQNMVYDNYTKFLQASETIHSMKDGLVTLSSQMKSLMSGLEDVEKHTLEVRKDLDPTHQQISRLVGISRLLDRIDFISRLPYKLHADVECQNYEHAVDIWLSAEKILESQTHYESFTKIKNECKSIIEEIKVKVRVQLSDENTPIKESVSLAATLIKLQFSPSIIIPELIAQQTAKDDKTISTIDTSLEPFALIQKVQYTIVLDSTEFVEEYDKHLSKFATAETVDDTHKSDKYITEYRQTLFKKITKLFSLKTICELKSDAFAHFVNEFSQKIGKSSLPQQMKSFTKWLLQKYIQYHFTELCDAAIKAITTTNKAQNSEQIFTETISNFKRDSSLLFSSFRELVEALPEAKQLITQLSTKHISQILNELDKVDARSCLFAFGLAQYFSIKLIPFIFEQVSRIDSSSSTLNIQTIYQNNATEIAEKCLWRFIESKRKMLSEIIVQGMTSKNWLDAKTPHDASISICLAIQEMAEMWSQLNQIMSKIVSDDASSSHSSRSSRNRFSGYSGSAFKSSQTPLFHGLREDNIHQIDRLFTTVNRLHLNRKIDFNNKAVLTATAMYSLKTLLELVRNTTFSCAGFNQMQVDTFFIYMAIFDKIDDTNLFNALIEEILSSVAERTIEPIPFKMVVLQEIYSRSDSVVKADDNKANPSSGNSVLKPETE